MLAIIKREVARRRAAESQRDELLALLEELLSADPDMPSYQDTVGRAEAAIEKAEKGAQA